MVFSAQVVALYDKDNPMLIAFYQFDPCVTLGLRSHVKLHAFISRGSLTTYMQIIDIQAYLSRNRTPRCIARIVPLTEVVLDFHKANAKPKLFDVARLSTPCTPILHSVHCLAGSNCKPDSRILQVFPRKACLFCLLIILMLKFNNQMLPVALMALFT